MVKVSFEKYRLELFRVIDFGIFDQEYKLCVLVEINDPSHETPERERDKKVVEICKEAGIPLVTFWTYGVNPEYIRSRLRYFLPLLNEEYYQMHLQRTNVPPQE